MRQKFILDLNPSTGELIEKIKCSSSGEIASAIKLARKALKLWSDSPLKTRVAALKKISKELIKEKDALGKLITDEMGKIYKSSVGEVVGTAHAILENVELAEKSFATEIHKDGNLITELHRVPVGVVAVITPWNFPVGMPESLLTPAILAGNAVVFKPSELTPLTGKMVYDIYNRHLPKGVINLLLGAEEVGEELVQSEIDMVGFVGSQNVGKKIMAASSNRLNRMVLELGGKDPMIVLKDADLERAAKYAVLGSLRNSGQVCVSVERIFVDEKISGKFEKLILENLKNFKVGNSYEDNDMGPMVSEEQRAHVMKQIEEAQRKGAQVIYGGNAINGSGYWLEPTVITNLADKHGIMHEETFGPVICIQKVKSPDEALEKANNSTYGLGATIWSKNIPKVMKYAKKIESGMIGVNQGIGGVKGTPWVGIKQSGFGYLGSVEGMRQFTVPKKISYKK